MNLGPLKSPFQFPSGLSHENRVIADCILLIRDTRSLKHVMEYEGMGGSTLCSIGNFPAEERCLLDQLLAFCLILITIELKRSFFLRPKCSGRPIYLPTPPSLWIWRMHATRFFKAPGVVASPILNRIVGTAMDRGNVLASLET